MFLESGILFILYTSFFSLLFLAVKCLSNSALPYHSYLFLLHGGLETRQGITARPESSGNPHSPPLHRLLSPPPRTCIKDGLWLGSPDPHPWNLLGTWQWTAIQGKERLQQPRGMDGDEVAMRILSFILHKNSNTDWEPSQNNHKDGDVSCNIYSAVVHFPQAKFPLNALSLSSLPSASLASQ